MLSSTSSCVFPLIYYKKTHDYKTTGTKDTKNIIKEACLDLRILLRLHADLCISISKVVISW